MHKIPVPRDTGNSNLQNNTNYTGDLNDLSATPGIAVLVYAISPENSPRAGVAMVLHINIGNNNTAEQIFFCGGVIYTRSKSSGVWNGWNKVTQVAM